jgi:hypothetical protein
MVFWRETGMKEDDEDVDARDGACSIETAMVSVVGRGLRCQSAKGACCSGAVARALAGRRQRSRSSGTLCDLCLLGSQQFLVRAAGSCSRVNQVNTAPARCLFARRGAGDSEGSCEITLRRVCGSRRVSGGCWCGGCSAIMPHSQWPDSGAYES